MHLAVAITNTTLGEGGNLADGSICPATLAKTASRAQVAVALSSRLASAFAAPSRMRKMLSRHANDEPERGQRGARHRMTTVAKQGRCAAHREAKRCF